MRSAVGIPRLQAWEDVKQEFITAVQHELPIKVFVFNNSGWGLVHLEMEAAGMPVFNQGATFKNPDFAMYALACGAQGFKIAKPAELRETVAEALQAAGPVVVDVTVEATEIPAMPHPKVEQLARFGIGKLRELISA